MLYKKQKKSIIKDEKFKIIPTNPVTLDLKNLEESFVKNEEEREKNYNPFKIREIQTYNPIHKIIFKNIPDEIINTHVPDTKYQFINEKTVLDSSGNNINLPVFIKYSPLLNACKYTINFYDFKEPNLLSLPKLNEIIFPKQDSIYNFSYVDGFFCYLCSKLLHNHNCINMIDYYGSYLCIQDKFKINISDDFPHLSSHTEFFENNNKYFTFSYSSCLIKNTGTNKNKTELNIEDNATENNLDLNFDEEPSIPHIVKQNIPLEKNIEYSDNNDFDIDALIDNENNTELNLESKSLSESESKNSTESTNNMKDTNSEESTIYETDYSDDDSNNNDDEDEESSNSDSDSETNYSSNMDDSSMEDDDLQMFAYINNFPVQMICLEKCKNTADSLFTSDAMTSDIGISFLTQVTFTLLILQKAFHFTHNDLHTNNIMYIETELEFIYYKYNSTIYKVPTYGYLFKIIDFGRAIYKYDETVYCSDSYSKGEDAHTLYNFKPFYNKNIPILEPNYSFDLCRLGISIYDMIMESVENVNKLDDFQSWVYRLCLDDDNKSIIYKRNGDARYSGFKMYKMIAKTVHNHSPVSQLAYSTIKQFITKEIPSNITHLVNIDKIPVYA